MRQQDTPDLIKIARECRVDDIVKYDLKTGIVLAKIDSFEIIYVNSAAYAFLGFTSKEMVINLRDIFEETQLESMFVGDSIIIKKEKMTLEVFSYPKGNYALLIINDVTRIISSEKEIDILKTLNENLKSVYEQYNDNTICITDDCGVVEYAGEACYRHCGISASDIIGMDIFELEKGKHFYPAVTTRVLASGETEVVMSSTNIGVTLITVGVPIFDASGKINKVISISRDFSKEFEIATLMIETKSDLYHEEERVEDYNYIVTCCNEIYSMMTVMRLVAKTNSTVLITGETGTGKGLFARYIHDKSTRKNGPFVVVNCGAIAENVIESELFGYDEGTFTGGIKEGKIGLLELANGGTLFLDEISEIPLHQQVKLLSVIQDKNMIRVGGRRYIDLDFRLLAATNKNLEEMIKEGTFREDLYYRLNVVNLKIPSLKDRKEDVPLLIKHFLKKMNEKYNKYIEISEGAIKILTQYSWPGNVRELENMIEMLSVTTQENIIHVRHLPQKVVETPEIEGEKYIPVEVKGIVDLKEAIQETERQLIKIAIIKTGGNHQRVADLLGVDRSTITRKISQYEL